MIKVKSILVCGAAVAMVALGAFGVSSLSESHDASTKNTQSSVTTNENGTVSRVISESSVTTNGNMVTERRRETRTTADAEGNVLDTSTSEYAQSYVCHLGGTQLPPPKASTSCANSSSQIDTSSFLGLRFGEVFEGTNFVDDISEPRLLRASFRPAKELTGFDDYFVYVTPKTHRIVKVYACAKSAIDSSARPYRNYLIEALEKRYGAWAQLRSCWRPLYQFNLGCNRYVNACLRNASETYETIVMAGDGQVELVGYREHEALREEARKAATARRNQNINEAAEAF